LRNHPVNLLADSLACVLLKIVVNFDVPDRANGWEKLKGDKTNG